MTEAYLRPDWVLVGVTNPDGMVSVYGSLELSEAALKCEIPVERLRRRDTFRTILAPPSPVEYRLTATMESFAVSHAPSYGEALTQLFREWDADAQRDRSRPAPPTLGKPSRPALPEGSSRG